MWGYSVQPRYQIFAKSYGFFNFTRNVDKNVGKSIIKKSTNKYSQKIFDHAKESAIDVLLQKEQCEKQQKQYF